jgi:hypothetical protein
MVEGGLTTFCGRRALLMDVAKSSLTVLALLCFCLVSWTTAAEETHKRHPAAIAPQGGQLTFQTLDGNTQQVNPDEIWRIRATYTSDEPPDAIVIDYAFQRVYVKESLASVVEKVGGVRPLKKFTLPGGGPVYIVAAKVTGVTRAIPHQSHPNAHAIINSLEGQTQVQETPQAISEALVK